MNQERIDRLFSCRNEQGFDIQYGARPLKRAIQTYLEDGLSELIISSSLKEGDTIQVTLNEEKGELEMKVVSPE